MRHISAGVVHKLVELSISLPQTRYSKVKNRKFRVCMSIAILFFSLRVASPALTNFLCIVKLIAALAFKSLTNLKSQKAIDGLRKAM